MNISNKLVMLSIRVGEPIVSAWLEVGIEGRQLVRVLSVLQISKSLSEHLSSLFGLLIYTA